MRAAGTKRDRTPHRLRFVGTAASLGAAAVVAIMALSAVASAGVATPGVFKGAVSSSSLYRDQNGCVTLVAPAPHWSKLTGDAKMSLSDKAATCSKAKGGSAFESYAYTQDEVNVLAPVHHVLKGNGGVNVTWNIALTSSDAASAISHACLPSFYSYDYNAGTYWYNVTEIFHNCEVQGYLGIGGYANLIDTTTGMTIGSSNYWYGAYNYSGFYMDNYTEWVNYSNTYTNYTYTGNYSYNYGPSGTLASYASYNPHPTWFINSTAFHAKHKYTVSTYLYVYGEAIVYNVVGTGTASAMVNTITGANHADLAFVVW